MRRKLFINFFTVFFVFLLFLDIIVFGVLNQNVEESYNSQYNAVSKQIVTNYNSYFETVIDTSNTLVDLLNTKENSGEEQISSLFEFTSDVKSDIIGMSLYDENGYPFAKSTFASADSLNSSDLNDLLQTSETDSTMYVFSSLYADNYSSRVYLVRSINFYDELSNKVPGYILIEMNFDKVIDMAETLDLGESGYMSIVDSYGSKIYGSNSDSFDIYSDTINSLYLGTMDTRISDNRVYVKISSIEKTPWRMALFANASGLEKTHNTLLLYLIAGTFIALLVALVIISRVSIQLTKPLKALEKHMLEIDEDNDLIVIDETYDIPEIQSLTNSFNEMINEINKLVNQVVEKSNAQRLSELKSLQNQINPHFLYNTLDSIIYLAENDENEKTVEMTVALARLFRISISRGKFIISVKNEIEHARCYLVIQSIRYKDAFKYRFEIDEDILEENTMKLILQPLIENAIYHGLKNRIDEGLIVIKGYKQDECIIFEVTDNGYGITEEKIEDLYKTFNNPDLNDGVGVKNVYQRLKLYFGKKANLEIISELDEGTTIKLQIPISGRGK